MGLRRDIQIRLYIIKNFNYQNHVQIQRQSMNEWMPKRSITKYLKCETPRCLNFFCNKKGVHFQRFCWVFACYLFFMCWLSVVLDGFAKKGIVFWRIWMNSITLSRMMSHNMTLTISHTRLRHIKVYVSFLARTTLSSSWCWWWW